MLDGTRYFLSFNSADREWADWIGVVLEEQGGIVSNHFWEIGAGGHIIKWMRNSLDQCDKVVSLFSPNYLDAAFSQVEQDYGIYSSIEDESERIIPIVINECKIPSLIRPLKRITIYYLPEEHAEEALIDFFRPPARPAARPPFPGMSNV